MPHTGDLRRINRRFAVGNPSVRPEPRGPARHGPSMRYGRPEQARRAVKIARVQPFAHRGAAHPHAVETKGAHLFDAEAARSTGAAQSSRSCRRPCSHSENHRPPPCAGHPEPRRSTHRRSDCGVIARMCSSKRSVTSRSTPSAASAMNFSRHRVRRGGASPGSMNSFELGSNTSTVAAARNSAARALEHADHLLVAEMHAVVVAHGQNAPAGAARLCRPRTSSMARVSIRWRSHPQSQRQSAD